MIFNIFSRFFDCVRWLDEASIVVSWIMFRLFFILIWCYFRFCSTNFNTIWLILMSIEIKSLWIIRAMRFCWSRRTIGTWTWRFIEWFTVRMVLKVLDYSFLIKIRIMRILERMCFEIVVLIPALLSFSFFFVFFAVSLIIIIIIIIIIILLSL